MTRDSVDRLAARVVLLVTLAMAAWSCSGRLGDVPDADADTASQRDGDFDDTGPGHDADTLPDAGHDADVEPSHPVEVLVGSLDVERFTDDIRQLSGFGDRSEGSASYAAAEAWLDEQLAAAGYDVERHDFQHNGHTLSNLYVTKIGDTSPDQMIIVSAHLDGRGGGGAADDDGSGVALVLEAARAMAREDLRTDLSVRFIFWNAEETGLNGSEAYVSDRSGLQGVEDPAGSGRYPEPTWTAMIQHDMILFDHGVPPQPAQSAAADVDVEYKAGTRFDDASQELAERLVAAASSWSTDYPAEVGDGMSNTDSVAFQDHTATVSVRENRRTVEIGAGSNPHWHQPTDLFSTYSEDDFRLGFNALQMTLAATAELAGAWIEP